MMKKIFSIIFFLTIFCIVLQAQPRYNEHLVFSPSTVTHTNQSGYEISTRMPSLSYSRAVVGSNLYAVYDVTALIQILLDLRLYLTDGERESLDSIDMAMFLWGTGKNLIATQNYVIGAGATIDTYRINAPDKSGNRNLGGVGFYANAMILYNYEDMIYNFTQIHFGPVFTNRQTTPIDGWGFIIKSSFSLGIIDSPFRSRRLALSIAPEYRYFKVIDRRETEWKSHTRLLHFGLAYHL